MIFFNNRKKNLNFYNQNQVISLYNNLHKIFFFIIIFVYFITILCEKMY